MDRLQVLNTVIITDQRRSCTDLPCFIVFCSINLIIFGISVKAWVGQSFRQFLITHDVDGRKCGADYPNFPYLYFASPHPNSLWVTVCVQSCPQQNDKLLKCIPNSKVGCEPINSADPDKSVQIYDSYPFLRFCMPQSPKIASQISQVLGSTMTIRNFLAIKQTWPTILLSVFLCIVLSLFVFFILRYLAGAFIYLIISAIFLGCLTLGIYFILNPYNLKIIGMTINHFQQIFIGSVFILIGSFVTILLICYRHRISLASAITRVSARFVNQNCLLAFLLLAIFCWIVLYASISIFELVGIYSLGTPLTAEQNKFPIQKFQFTNTTIILCTIHIFQLFWTLCFIKEIGSFVIAGTSTNWYFQDSSSFKESIYRTYKYHIGSVCVGSFFISIFGVFKFLYESLKNQDQSLQSSSRGIGGFCKSCCSCLCCFCITYLFNWFNNGAYTYIHLTGDNYCASACQIGTLMIQQPIATSIVSFVKVLFSTIVKLGISITVLIIAYILLTKQQISNDNSFKIAMVIIGVICLVIASLFESLYSDAMQSLYLCFLADSLAGGKSENAPKQLSQLLDQTKKQNHFL